MMESLKSITEIPDLRKRILFTLLMLAIYRLGSFVPTPGHQRRRLRADVQPVGGLAVRTALDVFGRQPAPADGFCARDHAVHYGIHHSAIAGRGFADLEKLQKEGELGRKKITEYTRWLTVGLERVPGVRHRRRPAARDQRGNAAGGESGSVLHFHHRADADDRRGLRHVVGRTDHGARASATGCRC